MSFFNTSDEAAGADLCINLHDAYLDETRMIGSNGANHHGRWAVKTENYYRFSKNKTFQRKTWNTR